MFLRPNCIFQLCSQRSAAPFGRPACLPRPSPAPATPPTTTTLPMASLDTPVGPSQSTLPARPLAITTASTTLVTPQHSLNPVLEQKEGEKDRDALDRIIGHLDRGLSRFSPLNVSPSSCGLCCLDHPLVFSCSDSCSHSLLMQDYGQSTLGNAARPSCSSPSSFVAIPSQTL